MFRCQRKCHRFEPDILLQFHMKISDLTLIVYFPPCAGGKFVINSLGLSKYCTLHDYNLALWDSRQTAHDQQYYQTKLKHTLHTVPVAKNSTRWSQHEMGNARYLVDAVVFEHSADRITKQQQHFCAIAHTPEDIEEIKKFTHSTTVIKLSNFSKWLRVSSFKHAATANDIENKVANYSYIDHKELAESTWYYTIDIDTGMYDQTFMQRQIMELYHKLGWDDFDSNIWSQYYQRYINSHTLS